MPLKFPMLPLLDLYSPLNTQLLATYMDEKREELFTSTFSKLKVLSLASTTSKEAHIRF